MPTSRPNDTVSQSGPQGLFKNFYRFIYLYKATNSKKAVSFYNDFKFNNFIVELVERL